MGKFASSAKDLEVYQLAYRQAMELFHLSNSFPSEEKYSLTSQIRRSSRSVQANLREAWAKRRYEAHFISKLTDCDGENQETDTHMDFARDCGYIDPATIVRLQETNQQIGRMLGKMITNPQPWIIA
ncbi:MAG: four helix bundle protein [Akkermansiaceae bacterium]|nr:four helix bundle protein [Akkermansiaceae bacterium]